MPSDFSISHAFTAKWEGGLSDVPQDRGGITKYGVSIVFLKNFASTQRGRDILDRMGIILPINADTIRNLTKDHAEALFRVEFWTPLNLEQFPQRIANILYDMAVNHGCAGAVRIAQQGAGFTGRDVDGVMGPKTRAALSVDSADLAQSIINARRAYYAAIIANNPSQSVFEKGWANRANDLARVNGLV